MDQPVFPVQGAGNFSRCPKVKMGKVHIPDPMPSILSIS